MGWFDSPAISVRKQVPDRFHSQFNTVESFALDTLGSQPNHLRPYQLGIVVALWVKAAEISGELSLPDRSSRRVQDVYASCVKSLRGDSYLAFKVLVALSEQGGTFSVPREIYEQLAANVAGVN